MHALERFFRRQMLRPAFTKVGRQLAICTAASLRFLGNRSEAAGAGAAPLARRPITRMFVPGADTMERSLERWSLAA